MRVLALVAGFGLLAMIWGGPLLGADRASFAAHMLAHMGVVALAAPLLALGVSGSSWDFSGASPVFAPVPASLVELVVVWGWHAPAMRQFVFNSAAGVVAEQASFLAAGFVLWLCCIGRGASPAAGAFGLLLTSVHMTLLGALLTLAPRPLFGEGMVTCLGLTLEAGKDQHLGGVFMLLIGGAIYLAGGLALVARLLAAPHPGSAAMKLRRRHLAALGAPVVVLAIAWIGFFNIGASSGHWRITVWFLELAMQSAIRTYALAVAPPEELPQPPLPAAATHYARGCAFCHGAPGAPRNPAVLEMLPPPPDLASTVEDWTDAQLFRIVKHGIRFTGMPAWPSQARDDEVWMMVAFLRGLPDLDAEAYRALVRFDLEPSSPLGGCVACHGADGAGGGAHMPILAGQSETYLRESLLAYAEGRRASGIMQVAIAGLAPDEMSALSRHFASQPPAPRGPAPQTAAGAEIAAQGRPADGIPACLDCHGGGRDAHFPSLAGQRSDYIAAQLGLFRSGGRGGTPYGQVMAQVARRLDDADIVELATYFAGLPPGGQISTPDAPAGQR